VQLDQDAIVLNWREKARTYRDEAGKLTVDSDETDTAATAMLGIGSAIQKAAETKRTALVKPLNDEVKAINDFFKRELAPFVDARPGLEQKSLAWRRKKAALKAEADARAERERLAAEALAAEAVKAEQAGQTAIAEKLLDKAVESEGNAAAAVAVAAQPIRNTVVTSMGASTIKRTWTFKVLDLAQIPSQYLVLDDKAVREAIRQGVREIAGLEIFQDESLSVRA
jgi:hypothetical protein